MGRLSTTECTYLPTYLRQKDGFPTKDPATVLQATQDSFLRQHTPTQDTLEPDTKAKIDPPPPGFQPRPEEATGKTPLHHPRSPEGHPQSLATQNPRLRRPPCRGILPPPRPPPPHPRPPPLGHRHGADPPATRLGKRCPPPLQKRGLGKPGQLAPHSLCGHGG